MRIERRDCCLQKSLADSVVIIQRQNVTTPSQADSSIARGRKAGVLLIKYEVSGLLQPIEDFQRPWILRTIVDDYEFAIWRRVPLNAGDRVLILPTTADSIHEFRPSTLLGLWLSTTSAKPRSAEPMPSLPSRKTNLSRLAGTALMFISRHRSACLT